MNSHSFLALVAMLALFVGCEVPELDIPETEEDRIGKATLERNKREMEEAGIAGEEVPVRTEQEAASEEPKEFTARDSKKGKKSREAGGYLGTVVATLPYAENKAFMIQFTQAMNTYNALNDGKYPKTQEEFDEKIIKEYKLTLPVLEDDEEFVYDPEEPLVLKFRKKQQ